MLWSEVTILALLCGVAVVDSSPVTCGMKQAERCLDPFQEHLEKGVAELASLDDQNLAVVCRKYEVASKCISYLLYNCSDIKAKYKPQLDQFEYACSHLTTKDEFWPFMGDFSEIANNSAGTPATTKHTDELTTAMKASMAAVITFIFIMICATAEIVTCVKTKRRVKEAALAAADQEAAADQKA